MRELLTNTKNVGTDTSALLGYAEDRILSPKVGFASYLKLDLSKIGYSNRHL